MKLRLLAVKDARCVESLVMLCVFRSLHIYIIPRISFVRYPSNSFHSILFFRFHPFDLRQGPICRILVALFAAGVLLSGCGSDDGSESVTVSETIRTSLHGTTHGMGYWYASEQGGFQGITNIPYENLDCKNCHVPADVCDTCHLPDFSAPTDDRCLACHGRQKLEQFLGFTDVHRSAGMECVDCHTRAQVHGDNKSYDSMFNEVISLVDCTDCHAVDKLSANPAHESHGNKLHCTACHMQATVTCYNCHFESALDGKGKVPYGAFADWRFLVKWRDQVHQGNILTSTYQGQSFMVIAPFSGHSVYVPPSGYEICHECHDNQMVQEYQNQGTMTITWWDAVDAKVEHFPGVIPVPKDWQTALKLTYVTLDQAGAWVVVNNDADLKQMLFCEPLDNLPE